ncbi:MAG: lipoate--protein ligase family protein [Actinobacteria bacterium]|nr:lipoate--protein ligase family protein [Actinomycetota bacterium]
MDEREWRFISTDVNDAYLNMAIDEAILDAHIQGCCPPTLRVYRWDPRAISVGYFQNLETEIDAQKCQESGVDVVRRLTGGKAILHDDELTYSIVTSEEYGSPKSLARSYWLLNQGLIAAYGILGLKVGLEAHPGEPSSAACFSGAGSADLTFEGRKVCGSAQYRRGTALLQHGSLPISVDAPLLFSALQFPSDAAREEAQAEFGRRAVSLSEIHGETIGWEELAQAVFNGFQSALGITFHEETLSAEEIDSARSLSSRKYRSPEWHLDD